MIAPWARPAAPRPELSGDPAFARRVARLAAVSAVMLGVIWRLSLETQGNPLAPALLLAGWVSMPTLLVASLWRPMLRLLLVIPSTFATVGALLAAVWSDAGARAGWALVLCGLLLGDVLGLWLWLGLAPARGEWSDPFSRRRWTAIAVHVALVLAGVALVFAA